MPRIKVKQMEERVSTQGLHMGGNTQRRRKLEPGEVVEITEDFLLPDGRPLLDVLWKTGKCEMTLDPVTRPLDYENYREARLCSPSFIPRGTSDEIEMQEAREAVAERLSETESEAPETDSPADDTPDSVPPVVKVTPKQKRDKATLDRRAERRAALEAANRGAALSTR